MGLENNFEHRIEGQLGIINKHERDDKIIFEEKEHIYTIEGIDEKPISVTTLIHSHFPHFDADKVIDKMMNGRNWENSKYFGMKKEEIKKLWDKNGAEASNLGTLMHADIERFLNDEAPLNPNTTEFGYFRNFYEDFKSDFPEYKPYRTEWVVYDEDRMVAGSIDCIMSDDDGNIIILDWKRSKEIKESNPYEKGFGVFSTFDNCNYNHYTFQLNIYKHILETKYNKKVKYMFIVVFYPENDDYLIYNMQNYDLSSSWEKITSREGLHH